MFVSEFERQGKTSCQPQPIVLDAPPVVAFEPIVRPEELTSLCFRFFHPEPIYEGLALGHAAVAEGIDRREESEIGVGIARELIHLACPF